MKCPLLCIALEQVHTMIKPSSVACLKEECAWYDSIIQTCLIYTIHTDLAYLCARLKELVDKMPHEEQFRK